MADRTFDTQVLIAGGGLVGLSAAMFLAQHGVRSLAVERLKESSPLPRAAFFHMRTLEMFRGAGIENDVREGSFQDFVPEGAVVLMESVAGGKTADIIGDLNEGVEEVSPCRRLFLNQPNLEPILRRCATDNGAQILQGHEVTGLTQDDGGVSLRIREVDTGTERELTGRFLIAADGAHSTVREQLGIRFDGRGVFSNSITIYFQADLSPWVTGDPATILYVKNAAVSGFFRMNRAQTSGFFVVNSVGDPTHDPAAAANAAADVSEPRLIELLRAGIGVPDIEVTIEGVSRWRATADVAHVFRRGRTFIAGDAAHLMPPNGGFGGNTGIHDAHNLAWKLAQVLNGAAGEKLLDTYEDERKPVSTFTVEQAFSRYVLRTAPWLQSSQEIDDPVHDFKIEIGYLYESSAVLTETGTPTGSIDPRTALGVPGSRAPHLWIEQDGKTVSTLDLTGRFLLLAGSAGAAWLEAAQAAAETHGLDVDAYCVGVHLKDPAAAFTVAFGIASDGASLIRPDGFVAWRARTMPPDPTGALGGALRAILALPG